MLVLGRKKNESILIGEEIRVTIIRDGNGTGNVRLGIECPSHIPILRNELVDECQQCREVLRDCQCQEAA